MIRLGGDIRHLGWDVKAEIQASQFDQIIAIVKGLSKETPDPSDFYPRPGTRVAAAAPAEPDLFAPTIADFNVGTFMGIISKQ